MRESANDGLQLRHMLPRLLIAQHWVTDGPCRLGAIVAFTAGPVNEDAKQSLRSAIVSYARCPAGFNPVHPSERHDAAENLYPRAFFPKPKNSQGRGKNGQ